MGGIWREGHPRNLAPKEAKQMLFQPREEGQGLIEYALILVLVAIVVVVILVVLGPSIGSFVSKIIDDL